MSVGETGRSGRWWSFHTHSRHSANDAMSGVTELVTEAARLGYPALALTDHGRMGGVAELYTACRKEGLAPLPGLELYVTPDAALGQKSYQHLTVAARTAQGYLNLVGLNNLAQRSFFHRPKVDMAQLAGLAEDGLLDGLALGTGCRSGPVVRALTERGPAAARQVVRALASWFPLTYVELMDHGFQADGMWDWEIVNELVAIADAEGLPYIITSDTHYTRREDREAHDALKTLVVHQGVEIDERRFNGEGYWLVDEAHLEEIYAPAVLDRALDSLADLAESASVAIPALDTFALKIPDVTFKGTEMDTLSIKATRILCERAEKEGWSKALLQRATERLDAELDVVEQSGFAGYLLFVDAICEYMRQEAIWYHVRGSATGSFLLYLLEVTRDNPLPGKAPEFWDIRFDRFLSPDRSSPPDVDIDIEHWRRDEVVQRFSERYPTLQVGTTMTYGITSESEDEDAPAGGSLAVKYYAVQRQLGTEINSWDKVRDEDKVMLKDLAERNLVSGRGAHPGGYVFAPDEDSIAFMPLDWISSSKTMVTAWDKGEVEKAGLPKVDLLGSRVLTALKICCDLIVGGDGREFYDSIPKDDKQVLKRCGAGQTVGLFQLGGWTNRKVVEQIDPKHIKDLVAVQALARPAPMNSGFTRSFMRRRDKVEPVPEMHDDIAAETRDTYGLAIYQEQLVGVLRRLGLGPVELTKLLKAVKASGKQHAEAAAKVMEEAIGPLVERAKGRGWNEADVAWLTGCLYDYGAGYSFGKAHSVRYGVCGYDTAWLAVHEPLAYWTGMLTAYDGVKDPKTKEVVNLRYKKQARNDGVRVLGPHVNHSGLTFTPDPEAFAIREGLTSIPHVGEPAALELIDKRPFASLVDLAQRCGSKVTCTKDLLYGADVMEVGGVMSALAKAHALDGIPVGEPMRKAKGRKRKCDLCKTTFPTPLDYEDHVEADHLDLEGDRDEP